MSPSAPAPFPLKLGGAFTLIDQTGALRSEADPEGAYQLFFFGYAQCRELCPAALTLMEDISALASARGVSVRPVLISLDPDRDTPEAMAAALGEAHPSVVGLTGDAAELAGVRRLFQVERKLAFEDPEHGPVYAHGSLIYLMSPAGGLLTIIPPVVTPERGAEIVLRYAAR